MKQFLKHKPKYCLGRVNFNDGRWFGTEQGKEHYIAGNF